MVILILRTWSGTLGGQLVKNVDDYKRVVLRICRNLIRCMPPPFKSSDSCMPVFCRWDDIVNKTLRNYILQFNKLNFQIPVREERHWPRWNLQSDCISVICKRICLWSWIALCVYIGKLFIFKIIYRESVTLTPRFWMSPSGVYHYRVLKWNSLLLK